MRVSFESYALRYKGITDTDLPIFERTDIKYMEGEVVDTVVMKVPNSIGDMNPEPCFVVSLDDGTFTYVAIKECKKVKL